MDLFRTLGSGARFNFKRFREDAEKLNVLDTKRKNEKAENEKQKKPRKTDDMAADVSESDNEQTDDNVDDSDTSEEDVDLTIMGSIKSKCPAKSRHAPAKKKRKMSEEEKNVLLKIEKVNIFRKQQRIHVYGSDIADPIASFDQLKDQYHIHSIIWTNIQTHGYQQPTAIQMQAIPVMLQRREILACAPTGSGKTAAFVIPILHHLKEPRNLGFRALILAPTRELANQTYQECCRLSEGLGFRIHLIEKAASSAKKFGPKSGQKFDILVSTPNRLVYMLKQDPPTVTLYNVEWLIVDESDKLFEEGKQSFRNQLATIYKACDSTYVRRALFSATFAHDVEEWCKLNLDNLVSVYVGTRNSATETVDQEILFVGNESGKLLAVRDIFRKGFQPPVLIFVQSKERSKELFRELIYDGFNVDVIHAGRPQQQRDNVVKSFRAGKIWVLIATDLMGRGIDFKGVNLVINYDFPNSAVSYIHRIGRTGRAGRKGKAVTFFTQEDALYLRSIANVMKESGCQIPDYMLKLKKPSKKLRRKLEKTAPERQSISKRSHLGDSEVRGKKSNSKIKINKFKKVKKKKGKKVTET